MAVTDEDLVPVPNACRYDYAGSCWWCGALADSREHKWKKSEVVKLFGKGSYGDSVLWVHEDGVESVRGPKAASLMFGPTLCGSCNSTRSQSFDRAYEVFSNYVIDHHDNLLTVQLLDFEDIFGEDTSNQLPKLARYYAKHIGCRIAERAGRVPDDIVQFLDQKIDNPSSVFSQLGIREALRNLTNENDEPEFGLSLRNSVADYSQAAGGSLNTFKSGVGVGAIEFIYDVNLDPSRSNIGNGIFSETTQVLWPHGEDLYNLQMYIPTNLD